MTDPTQIAARLAAATPGPWDIFRYKNGGGRIHIDEKAQPERHRDLIADMQPDPDDIVTVYNEGDREFLFHAPTDIAYLLAQREAVLKLHVAFEWSFGFGPVKSCRECARLGASETDAAYPCATVLAMGGGQ